MESSGTQKGRDRMNNLDMAIQMEEQGASYYKLQSETHKGTPLELIFIMLAEDEIKHREILKSRFQRNSEYSLLDNGTLNKSLSIFSDQRTVIQELRQVPSQLNVYKEALDNEQQSIDLYKSQFKEAKTDSDKELFEFLIKEEMNHHNILEEIVILLTRTEDWVESAEFGKRKEY
jgi:rubrerythrin